MKRTWAWNAIEMEKHNGGAHVAGCVSRPVRSAVVRGGGGVAQLRGHRC